jgi:hypothetical protein
MLTTGGGISGTIPDTAGGGVYVGSSPPSSALTNKVWFKTDAAGRPLGVFMFYNGNWRKVYTGVVIGEIRFYVGASSVFDGTGRGIIGGDADGWALCNGNNGTPNYQDYFPCMSSSYVGGSGWQARPSGLAAKPYAPAGGAGNYQIQTNNLPLLYANTRYRNVSTGGGSALNLLICDGSAAACPSYVYDQSGVETGSQLFMDNAPPWIAMAAMMFIGYQ